MKNLFVEIGGALAKVGDWVADAVKDVTGVAAKVTTVLAAEKPLEAPFVSALSAVVTDLEALLAESGTAVTADGLNFAADSGAYKTFLQLISDAKTLAPIAQEAFAILKGEIAPPPPPVTPAPGDTVIQLAAPVAAPASASDPAAASAPVAASVAAALGPRVLQHS